MKDYQHDRASAVIGIIIAAIGAGIHIVGLVIHLISLGG